MTTPIRLALLIFALVLLLGAGAWYYLFGPNRVDAAELVPADTIVFATIPNAAKLVAGYQTSHLKQVVDAPEAQPLFESIEGYLGNQKLSLLQSFLPNLSGQSFLALTHFDPDHPAEVGLIAGLKPKLGTGDFAKFIDQIKAAYPTIIAQGTTGAGQVEGLDYQWIQGPGSPDKICVAQYHGWIVTGWGEASLRDWWERLQKKSATPSLAQNPDYMKSLGRVGKNPGALLYLDYHALADLFQKRLASRDPAGATYFATKLKAYGAAMVGTGFEDGDIADHFSILIPRQAQLDAGASATPCPFETLKFTSPDTHFYWGANMNWDVAWKNLQEETTESPAANPVTTSFVTNLQNWARSENIDIQKNIIDALGNEFSVQAEWSGDSQYPEVGFMAKLAKPDDFTPTVAALLDTVRKAYATTAVVNEINSNGQKFATLKFVTALPVSPTITEDGPYFGFFLTENQAVRSFQRDASVGLLNNAEFKREIGDRQAGASQILFFDSPQFLNRAYQAALPYIPLAGMMNRTLGAALQHHTLPPDLHWLAPIGAWSFVTSSDDDGMKAYSVSGLGNQGIFLAGGLGSTAGLMRMYPPFAGMLSSVLPPAPTPAPVPSSLSPQAPSVPLIVPPQADVVPAPPMTAAPDAASNAAPVAPTPLPPTDATAPSSPAAPSTNQ
jgi:hypothetical protein